MCYDSDARPPDPPGAAGKAHGQDIVLTASDGNRFAAYAAFPDQAGGAQVLIYPDIRGLHQFYKELALRFAETGIAAVAIDYFGRTAGLTPRDDSFEFRPHVEKLTLQSIWADARAGLEHLRTNTRSSGAAFTLGFCIGGGLSLYTATEDFGLAGVIAFYSGFGRTWDEQKGSVLEAARFAKVPVLGLYGGADPSIPPDQVQRLDQTLDQAGVAHEIVTYPGAPHSFFDRRATDFADASADAWRRVLAFISTHQAT
jgi:carboxymethylenebutenolidase